MASGSVRRLGSTNFMPLPCGRYGRADSCPLMSITAPQKHLDWPLASCVGSLHPESHIAYFHAVQARCFRCSSKSASVRLARKTSHANSKSPRASSKLAAVPDVQSPGSEPG